MFLFFLVNTKVMFFVRMYNNWRSSCDEITSCNINSGKGCTVVVGPWTPTHFLPPFFPCLGSHFDFNSSCEVLCILHSCDAIVVAFLISYLSTSGLLARTIPIFTHFDLNYVHVKFCDCILHS